MDKFIQYLKTDRRAKIAHIFIVLCLWAFIIFFLLPRSCDQQIEAEQAASKDARDYAIIHKYD